MLIAFASIITLLMYILFSTLFHNSSFVGAVGKFIGEANIAIFGPLAYINFLFILLPLFKIYSNPKLKKSSDIYIGWSLLLLAFLILQALIFSKNSGALSILIYNSLLPFIGKAGLILLFFLTFCLSICIITNKGLIELINDLNLYTFTQKLKNFKNKIFSKLNFKFFRKKQKNLPPLNEIATSKQKRQSVKKTDKKPKKLQNKKTSSLKLETKDINKKSLEQINTPKIKTRTNIVNELEENAKLLEDIELGEVEKPKNFVLPKLEFLQKPPKNIHTVDEAEIDRKQRLLIEKLKQFKIEGDIKRTYTGPLVTTFEFKPAPNVKVSKILNLQDDLAMALSAETIRIQAPIPGKDVVGIEIPNDEFETIYLREILESEIFKKSKSPLTVALGKDIVGKPFVTDLKKLPHLLIAGTTGSGKSVGINAMLLSLLYRNDPSNLKLILIDPKMLEFSIYNDIPHLLTPVIIEPKKAIAALANLVKEMERRYKLMAHEKVKNIDNYNQKAKKENLEKMPFIVVVIDELADLMMTAGKEVEYSIARLAQMARAAGIHIIVATQRPSVDVVTGLIKANLPARLSYRVGQKIDSKVILDAMGAEALLGRGDALFTPPGITGLVRLHAPWNTEEEIEEIVEFLKSQQAPDYDESYLVSSGGDEDSANSGDIELDPLFEKAKEIVLTDRKSSISYLQRKLQIGYNRSANIVEQLEKMGVLSAPNNKGNREILL